MAFDTTRLVNQVVQKGCLPEGRFDDQEILDLAFDCLLSEIIPIVIETRQDFLVTVVDIPVIAGQDSYQIPSRALNGVVREIKLLYGGQIINLRRKNLEDINDTNGADAAEFFYIVGNNIHLYPVPSSSGVAQLRIYYFTRPSRLVPVIETARITGINGNILSITRPTGWTSLNAFDLVRGRAHFDPLATDLTALSVTETTIEFSALPSGLIVGDYVTLADETCFPFIPPEAHVTLMQSAVTACLEAMGDPASANSAAKTTLLLENLKGVMCIRVEGEQGLGVPLF